MTNNTFAYQNVSWVIDGSDYGLFLLIASRSMQNEVLERFRYSDISVFDCTEKKEKIYSFAELEEWINGEPDKKAYFVRNFQILFFEPENREDNIARFNFSRDMLIRLRKNIVFCVDRATDDLLDRYAIDFYSYIKLKLEFEDDIPERVEEIVSFDSGLTIGTDIPIDFTEPRNKLLGRAIAYVNQAEDLKGKAKYPEAMSLLSAALKIRETLLGEDAPDTADTYNRIAEIYKALGDYRSALENAERAFAIHRDTLGEENLTTIRSSESLAGVYNDMGEYERALGYYKMALKIKEEILGTDHPSIAATYNNIAGVYYYMGEYGRALEYYEMALKIEEEVLGTDHPSTAATYDNIAGAYEDMGEYGRALEYYEMALKIREEVLGTDHPDTAATYNNIAGIYRRMGEYGRARELYSRALSILEEKLGKDHPKTVIARKNLDLLPE